MENKAIYDQYEQNRLVEKTAPKFDMLKTLETYKRSVDAFNSYGLKKKTSSDNPEAVSQQSKKVLGEKNWLTYNIRRLNKYIVIMSTFYFIKKFLVCKWFA